jgi:hypothetical protein
MAHVPLSVIESPVPLAGQAYNQEWRWHMPYELSTRERDLLVELLTTELENLAPEIHHAREHEYREDLRKRRELVRQLIDHLQVPVRVE